MALIKCFECGNEVSDNALFCTKCGVKLEPKKEVVTNKSNTGINKLITIFSAIFTKEDKKVITPGSIPAFCRLFFKNFWITFISRKPMYTKTSVTSTLPTF